MFEFRAIALRGPHGTSLSYISLGVLCMSRCPDFGFRGAGVCRTLRKMLLASSDGGQGSMLKSFQSFRRKANSLDDQVPHSIGLSANKMALITSDRGKI